MFVFCLWKNVHESIHATFTSQFIHSVLNSKKTRHVHFGDHTEFQVLNIDGKELAQVKLISL